MSRGKNCGSFLFILRIYKTKLMCYYTYKHGGDIIGENVYDVRSKRLW